MKIIEERRLLDSNFKELGNKINEIINYLESEVEELQKENIKLKSRANRTIYFLQHLKDTFSMSGEMYILLNTAIVSLQGSAKDDC